MSYEIKVTDEQIDEVMNECAEAEDAGTTKFRNMTYEQGVRATIEWLTEGGESPLND